MTQSPNRVMVKKLANCDFVILPLSLNVNVLFAKKLNTSAVEVDIKLLKSTGNPSATKANKIAKSIAVLSPPITAKRNFSACFFTRFAMVILLYKIQRASFGLIEDAANIFTDNTQ